MTGSSGGWQTATFDLSAYAGQQVEVVISYVTDRGVGGIGVVVDDTAVVVGGQVVDSEGFETGLGPWQVAGQPEGSPTGGTTFQRSEGLQSGAVSTRDTITFGFGLEQIGPAAERPRCSVRPSGRSSVAPEAAAGSYPVPIIGRGDGRGRRGTCRDLLQPPRPGAVRRCRRDQA